MAEAVVSIVIDGLVPLGKMVIQQANFLSGVSDQVELAQSELLLMRSFLKDADTKQEYDEVVRSWVNLVREAAYDLEDAVESFVLKVAFRRGGGMKIAFKRFACICTEGVDRYKIGSEIESITTKLSKLRLSMQSYEIKQTKGREGESSSSRQRELRQTYDHVTDDHDVVGLEKKVEELADHLVKEKRHRIVSIWGMGGVGKTTLAKQVYKHKSVKYHFDCFAWVSVSQQCDATTVMQDIFIQLSSATQKEVIRSLKYEEIAQRLYNFQQKRKCLVVLDDIWTLDAWNSLKNGFPVNEETESRIIITTRIQEVASVAKEIGGLLYESQVLNANESWDLFQKIAISKTDETDKEAKGALGKEMLKHCGGLPLAIIVLAGLLARKDIVHEWETVRENVDVYIRRGSVLEREYKGQNFGGASWILALSYENLPYRLKLCFLYLSQFPEDYEIPVKRLTHMWIAEGFISATSTELLEDVAYSCLSELVERCLVQVGDIGLTRKIKTCRLHDLMRDLCLLKAKEESFIHIVNFTDNKTLAATPTGRVRRLAVYFDDESCNLVIPTRDYHLRSLLYFNPPFYTRYKKFGLRTLFRDFGFLRVLKFEGMDRCPKLSSTIGNLVQLRFFSLRWSKVRQLPSAVENLVCLQTLDLRVSAFMMKVPNVFKKMEHLRHLYLPYIAIVCRKLSLARLSNLQTLVNINIRDCDLNAFAELTNLRKLCICARESTRMKKLEEILKSRNITYKHLRYLSLDLCWKIPFDIPWELVLRCRFIYKLSLKGKSTELPEALLSYANLTKLQLDSTNLKEDQIQILERLPKLKALQFSQDVFSSLTSNTLVCSSGGFLKLESLSLSYMWYLHEWRVEQGAMPSLCSLHIWGCYGLKGVPDGLQYITTLKEITINDMKSEFGNRLRESGEDFYKVKHVPSIMIRNIDDWERDEAESQREDAGMPEVELVVAHEESTVEDVRSEQENEAEMRLAAVCKVEESNVKNGEPIESIGNLARDYYKMR